MSTRALLSAAVISLAVQGCSTPGLDGGGGPPPIRTTSLNCNNATHPHKCRVDIDEKCSFFVCKFVVNVDEIHLVRNSTTNSNTDVDIVWRLPQGYVFCNKAASDGGVILKGTNDGQFDGMYSTDDANGATPADPDCKKHRHFHWNAKNTVPRPSYGYEYAIIFYNKVSGGATPTRYFIDPWVYND